MLKNRLNYYKNTTMNSKVAFILGIMTCQNVIYCFKISNTYINIFQLVTFVVFLFNLLTRHKEVEKALVLTDRRLSMFYGCCYFSIVLLFFVMFIVPDAKVTSFFSGLITYTLAFMYYVCVIIYKDDVDSFIKGITAGFFINVIVCVAEYICFARGTYFSLYNVFPQPFYYVSIPWENRSILIQNESLIYSYRASGLFLEASHFISYLSVVVLIVWTNCSKRKTIAVAVSVVTILTLISGSGTFAAYALTIALFFAICTLKEHQIKKTTLKQILLIGAIAGALLILGSHKTIDRMFQERTISDFLSIALKTSNILDADNSTRLIFMKNAIKAIRIFPLGIGCNMAPTVLNQLYGTYSTFSFLLSVILEFGPVAAIIYVWFLVDTMKTSIGNALNRYDVALGVSFLVIMAVQFANGIGLSCYILAIFALARIRALEKRKVNI